LIEKKNCFSFFCLFAGNLVVPEGRMTEMKNVSDFDKRKHSWNILNYFSDILLGKKLKI